MSVASMSDEPVPVVGGQAPMPVPAGPDPSAAAAALLLSRIAFGLLALVALVALVMVLVLWQRVGGMREQLARQGADAIAQSAEARTLAREANETVRDTAARLALNETRVAEVALQRSQLEELMQSLSRSRDENLVVDIESAVRLALQQTQVAGNTEPLLAALKAAEQRIARAAQPRLAPLARAIARDADRIRAGASGDSGEVLQRIDELIRIVDELPALNAVAARGSGAMGLPAAEMLAPDAPWWQRILWQVRQEARSLVRVGRIDRPEAVLVSPEQVFFLRENLKLKLLHARLALLSRQAETARSELAAVTASLNRYFDPASRRTQAAATLLQQLQAQIKTAETPRVDDTLAALATAAAGR
jgi:uroporphyrin-3 C-methyltransferase